MQTSARSLRAVLVLCSLAAVPAAFAQGALQPVGAPAPTMKSLAQIEARTDVATLPGDATAAYIISQPGSYYLTADVVGAAGQNGIRIEASNVALDLNGFSIRGSGAGSLHGIFAATSDVNGDPSHIGDLSIGNGTIRNWGATGLWIGGTEGISVTEVRVSNCAAGGIYVNGGATRIADCTVRQTGGFGISLTADDTYSTVVRNCVVLDVSGAGAPGTGISVQRGLVEHCAVSSIRGTSATGIAVGYTGGLVADCEIAEVSSSSAAGVATGISAPNVRDCAVAQVSANGANGTVRGIYSTYSLRVAGCRVSGLIGVNGTAIEGSAAAGTGESSVQSCVVSDVAFAGSGNGIAARTVLDCQVAGISGPAVGSSAGGIIVLEGGVASRCSVRHVEGAGIYAFGAASVLDCSIDRAGSDGVGVGLFLLAGARAERNRVSNSATGIQQSGTALVIGNFAMGNTTNFVGVNAAQIVTTYAAVAAGSSTQNVSL